MMKKFVLSLAVYGCVVVNAMDGHFDVLVREPQNEKVLFQLVELCVQKTGEDLAHLALKKFEEKSSIDSVGWKRIGAMLYAIVYDWDRAGFYGVGSCQHYVDGALAGKFGPFNLSDFKDEPYLSTTYALDNL